MAKTAILVADDEAIVATLTDQLQTLDYLVVGVTGCGEDASRLARELSPDLVVVDTSLQGPVDGVEAAGRDFDLPVVFFTAHSDRPGLDRAKLPYPFAYRVKPPGHADLAAQIEMVLYQHQAERRLRHCHAELERRVEERTHELALALDELRIENEKRLRVSEELRIKEHALIHQSRLAAMGEMIDNIAHQWRQPLNVLGLLAQDIAFLCEREEFDRGEVLKNCKKAMLTIRHMSETINDFREFFTPRKDKVVFSVGDEMDKVLNILEGSLRKENIEISIHREKHPETHGHPNEFSQVLLNILTNARDVLVERKVEEPQILITVGGEGEKACVTIADNAGGIPDDIIGRIFDPHFTTKETHGGTGVGLFMSKAIVEKHFGGRLTATNTDEGALFRIEI